MVHDPLSLLDALMVALSGFVIVFIMLAVLWGIIMLVSRAVTGVERSPAAAPAPAPQSTPAPAPIPASAPAAASAAPAVQTPPQVALEGVSEPEAACVMAIVSHETGIPLDELVFKSIKAV